MPPWVSWSLPCRISPRSLILTVGSQFTITGTDPRKVLEPTNKKNKNKKRIIFITNLFNLLNNAGKGEIHLRLAFGSNERKLFQETLHAVKDRPSKMGPPNTTFYLSKTLTEKRKAKKVDERFSAAKGLPLLVSLPYPQSMVVQLVTIAPLSLLPFTFFF